MDAWELGLTHIMSYLQGAQHNSSVTATLPYRFIQAASAAAWVPHTFCAGTTVGVSSPPPAPFRALVIAQRAMASPSKRREMDVMRLYV